MPAFPKWSTLRTFGNSMPVRMAAVMPFVGYLILLNESVVGWLGLSTQFFVEKCVEDCAANPIISRLYYLYFGLFFLGLGSFVYQWRCDPRIKKHETPEEYVAAVRHVVTSRDLQHFQSIIDRYAPGSSATSDFVGAELADPSQFERLKLLILTTYYDALNSAQLKSRAFVTVTYGFGLLVISIPAITTFVSVLRAFTAKFAM